MIIAVLSGILSGCGKNSEYIRYEYGVFLGEEPENVSEMEEYSIIVIDAQYFSKEQIAELKDSNHIVYSYINIGSVEDFRPYYKEYEELTLGDYENWPEEKWVDVSVEKWQEFIVDELAAEILDKGVDGLFVDNVDVYYNYQNDEIFEGVTKILNGLKAYGTYVMINGGDTYVIEYAERNGNLDDVMDAVNQESVFSSINWETETFSANSSEEREYFQYYIEMVDSLGKDVYLLEYTTDRELIKEISEYCSERNFIYYAADNLELLIPENNAGAQVVK
ncbi:MAG: endo alpha-1,4 polygalactosaminidase [Lachnospiraceae bacterium]|nr:endo alpha-1,4 polygalactosaminidase [Lachnospiraceae bacterium]MBQ9609321.1 endo alpha-1,4 polygalactosaminidase [Lachnospiraceae bacterium]